MKVLIAGGSGFIGKNLSIFFSKKNFLQFLLTLNINHYSKINI